MMRMLYRLGCCRHGDGTLNTRLTCIHPITFFVYNGYSLCEAILANAVVVRSYILLFYLTRICYLILLDFCLFLSQIWNVAAGYRHSPHTPPGSRQMSSYLVWIGRFTFTLVLTNHDPGSGVQTGNNLSSGTKTTNGIWPTSNCEGKTVKKCMCMSDCRLCCHGLTISKKQITRSKIKVLHGQNRRDQTTLLLYKR